MEITQVSREEKQMAKTSMEILEAFSGRAYKGDVIVINIKSAGQELEIKVPERAFNLFNAILGEMAKGHNISIISENNEISTERAAKLLGVSRPYVVKLLEDGIIPFKKVGTHRRIRMKDLNAYQERLREIREEKLQMLADQAQHLNLGY